MGSKADYTPGDYSEEDVSFSRSEGVGEIDLAIMCDTTSSMSKQVIILGRSNLLHVRCGAGGEIKQAQRLMQNLINAVKLEKLHTNLRIALIAYRDHPPEVAF